MSLTVTKIVKPGPVVLGAKLAVYQIEFDDSYPTGGEPFDLTADFDNVYSVSVSGNNATADNLYKIDAVLPGPKVKVTASNVLLQATQDPAGSSAGDFDQAPNATDLSIIGQLSVVVIGK